MPVSGKACGRNPFILQTSSVPGASRQSEVAEASSGVTAPGVPFIPFIFEGGLRQLYQKEWKSQHQKPMRKHQQTDCSIRLSNFPSLRTFYIAPLIWAICYLRCVTAYKYSSFYHVNSNHGFPTRHVCAFKTLMDD